MRKHIYRLHQSGAREVFDSARYLEIYPEGKVTTCYSCGRSWDDAFVSGVTPAPSARCPFEYQHRATRHDQRAEDEHNYQTMIGASLRRS